MRKRWSREVAAVVVAAAVGASLLVGCGDDGGGTASNQSAKPRAIPKMP